MTAQDFFEQAKQYYEEKEYSKAVKAYDQAILLDGKDIRYHFNQGIILSELNREEEALKAFDQAIFLDGKIARIHYYRGDILIRLSRKEEALKAFDQAISLDEKVAIFHFSRGFALNALTRKEEALSAYDRAILLDKKNAFFHFSRGYVLSALTRNEEALLAYDQAILLDEKIASYHFCRGIVLSDLTQNKEALSAYDQAISLNKKDASYHYNRGGILRELTRNEEALSAYDQAISLNEKNASYHYNRGGILNELTRNEEALSAYDQAISLNEKNAAFHSNRGVVLSDLNRNKEALLAHDQAILLDEKNATFHSNRGNALYKLDRNEEALIAYNQAISLDGKYPKSWYGKGNLFSDENFESVAQRFFFRSLLLSLNSIPFKAFLNTWNSNPKHPFFLQETFNQFLNSPNETIAIQEQVAIMCKYINFYLFYFEEIKLDLKLPSRELMPFYILINYFMGHPFKAFELLKERVLPQTPHNLMGYYYLINSCYEFLENEEPFIEKAIPVAEAYLHPVPKGLGQVILPSQEEMMQRYYAALIFEIDTEYQNGIDCIKDIWDKMDFLPLAYLYFYLQSQLLKEPIILDRKAKIEEIDKKKDLIKNEVEKIKKLEEQKDDLFWSNADTLKILEEPSLKEIATYIFKKEAEILEERKGIRFDSFAFGFPVHSILPEEENWWIPFFSYAHHHELSNAITLLQKYGKYHLDNHAIISGEKLKPFWECFKIEEANISIMQTRIKRKERERLGQEFLKEAKEVLQDGAINIKQNATPEELEKAIEYVIYERPGISYERKQAYLHLKEIPDRNSERVIKMIAAQIEDSVFGDSFKIYHNLIYYYFLSEEIESKDAVYLQFYSIYASAFKNKGIAKFLEGGAKNQVKSIVSDGMNWASTAVTAVNPVAGLTMAALTPFAKGSMAELFVQLLKKNGHSSVMMKYELPNTDGAFIHVTSFKEIFQEFVGEEKERLGDRFKEVYPLYGNEDWINES